MTKTISLLGATGSIGRQTLAVAQELGLSNTHFVTPSGLDADGHYTTARDLAKLAAFAMKNEVFREVAACKSAEVEFGDGLNILTGETGAGKWIIIGSVQIALGGKAPKEMIRRGCDSAYIELVFSIDDERKREQLKEHDV